MGKTLATSGGGRSSRRTRMATRVNTKMRNSRSLMCMNPGAVDLRLRTEWTILGDQGISNQNSSSWQQAPPPVRDASPVVWKCGFRGIIKPNGTSHRTLVLTTYAWRVDSAERASGPKVKRHRADQRKAALSHAMRDSSRKESETGKAASKRCLFPVCFAWRRRRTW